MELLFLGSALALLLTLATLHLAFVGNDSTTKCLSNIIHNAHLGREGQTEGSRSWDRADVSMIHLYGWSNCNGSSSEAAADGLRSSFFCSQGWEFLKATDVVKGHSSDASVSWVLASEASSTQAINEALPKMFAVFSERVGDSFSDSSEATASSITASLDDIRSDLAGIAAATFGGLQLRARGGSGRDRSLREILDQCSPTAATAADPCHSLAKHIERLSSDFASNALELFSADRVYLFSREKGYLMLSGRKRHEHNIRAELLEVPLTSSCFSVGGKTNIADDLEAFSLPSAVRNLLAPPADWLIHHVIGYDIIVSNWIARISKGEGFLLNTYSKSLFDLSRGSDGQSMHPGREVCLSGSASSPGWASRLVAAAQRALLGDRAGAAAAIRTAGDCSAATSADAVSRWLWQKAVVIGSTVFLYFTTSTLVSFTLKETQERMLRFTYLLQYYTRHQFSILKLVSTHMVESLVFVPIMVGIMGFLFEFLGDSLLTFLVLSLVWICEVYTVVTVRTMQSAVFFPRFSFMLFCGLYFYVFSYPFGFSYLALATVTSFMCYIMLHLWNTYELPALHSGDINPLNVRMLYSGGILSSASTLNYNTAAAIPMPPGGLTDDADAAALQSEEPDGSALAQIHKSARRVSPSSVRAPSSRARQSNVRHAGDATASAVSYTAPGDPVAAFPPLPSRKAPVRVSSRSSSKDAQAPFASASNDDADLGLSLDDDQVHSPYEAQIALSRRIQAQEMQEAVSKLLRSSSSRLNLLHMASGPGIGSSSAGGALSPAARLSADKRVASVDDFGYKRAEFSIFGDNSQN